MRITRTRSLLAVAGVLLLTGLAACAPSPAANPSGELNTASQEQEYEDWQIDFEKCLSDQGVDLSQFMTSASTGGEEVVDEAPAPPEEPTEAEVAAMQEAMEYCNDEVGEPPTRDDMPSDEEFNEMSLAFAACMREAGYDFPDPDVNSNGAMMTMGSDEFAPEDMDKCSQEAGFPGAEG